MLDYCGTAVAMGNASDEVKAHADIIAPPVSEEGIAAVLRQLF